MDSSANTLKPPYLSFATFWNFLTDLCSRPLPPQLDRSVMTNKSGTDQTAIMGALQFFDFLDAEGNVQPDLSAFKEADEEGRKKILRTLVETYYEPAVQVSAVHGTHQNLKDAFRDKLDVSGDTQRKAITFFLHAAKQADLDLSANFPKTRAGSGAPGAPRAKKTTPRKKTTSAAGNSGNGATGNDSKGSGSGEVVVVNLGAAGRVTVEVDVKWLQLDDETFIALRKAITDLKTLAAANEVPAEEDSADDSEPEVAP